MSYLYLVTKGNKGQFILPHMTMGCSLVPGVGYVIAFSVILPFSFVYVHTKLVMVGWSSTVCMIDQKTMHRHSYW